MIPRRSAGLTKELSRGYPVEIKVSSTAKPELAASLVRWRTLAEDKARPGYVVYGGGERRETTPATFLPWAAVGEVFEPPSWR